MKLVIVVRHGRALKARGDQDDRTRRLSTVGRHQLAARKASLPEYNYAAVMASSARRTVETAATLSGVRGSMIQQFPELYRLPGDDGDRMDQMFKELEYQPLRIYESHQLNNGCLQRFAEQAGEILTSVLDTIPDDATMLYSCHAVLGPLSFMSMTAEHRYLAVLREYNMSFEADAFCVAISGGRIVEIKIFDHVRV